METSVISTKPTSYSKAAQLDETKAQPQRKPSKADVNTVQSVAGDTLKLSAESLQLAKAAKPTNSSNVPSIENSDQARQTTKNIVEQLRRQASQAVVSQGSINSGTLKSLLT